MDHKKLDPEYPLHQVRRYAARILRAIHPHCVRARVAGSVRRRRPTVHDLDIVVLPKSLEAKAAIKARCAKVCKVVTDGMVNFTVEAQNGMRVEYLLRTR